MLLLPTDFSLIFYKKELYYLFMYIFFFAFMHEVPCQWIILNNLWWFIYILVLTNQN